MKSLNDMNRAIAHLRGKKVLILTTSNRWSGSKDIPKTTRLAQKMARELNAEVMHVPDLHIYHCEGNISDSKGNHCGLKGAELKDSNKNPTGWHRCWASINHKDDELWKITKSMFESDAVIFFISTRWGQTNAFYQKLIERLSFIENRWSSLEGDQILKNKIAGCVVIGHNWNVENVMENQMQIYRWFGFEVPRECSFCWQWTTDVTDESREGYLEDTKDFDSEFQIGTSEFLKESFNDWIRELNETAYEAGKRKPTAEEIEMCKSPKGFNQINHCKALGLIPREDGTKKISYKYGGEEE